MLERLKILLLARFHLASTAARVATLLGVMAAAAATVVFFGVSEDVVQNNGLATRDASRLAWITHHRTGTLVSGSKLLDTVGSVGVVLAVAVAVGLLLWWRRVPIAAAVTPVAAVLIAGATAGALKVIIDRARPVPAHQLISEVNQSFPSGHATDSAALGVSAAIVVAIYLLRRPLARLAVLAVGAVGPVAVAASRLELGVHWPTDVVAGLALGATVALVTLGVTLSLVSTPPADATAPGPISRVARWLRAQRGLPVAHPTAVAL
ncbi:MAG: phosphatase PAP2 family protein [Acidimicrobiia bacterium]